MSRLGVSRLGERRWVLELNLSGKWLVKRCKKPSTRWVAWRVKSKRKTGVVFDTWKQAFTYAIGMQDLIKKIKLEGK